MYFLKRLVLPLLLLFCITITINSFWEAGGFFTNISAELVGILITIFYVNWTLREHERQRWLPIDERIASRLQILLNKTISSLRDGLGLGDILDKHVGVSFDAYTIHKDLIRMGECVIAPAALSRIQTLNQSEWTKLARYIQNSHNDLLTFLNIFQTRLTPDQLSDLLDLQESLDKSLMYYSLFPDIIGVPESKWPQSKTSPKILQNLGCESAAKELQNICALSKKLSESVNRENA